MKNTAINSAIVLLLGTSLAAAQSPPDLMNYQGTLLRPDGTAEVGPKTLEFRIVNEASAIVWGPQTFEDLPLQQGKFNVLLGSDDDGTTISLAFQGSGDAARYLSVKVTGEATERLPLQRIASVPFALSATKVADGSVGTNTLQDGSVTANKLAPLTIYTARILNGQSVDLLALTPDPTTSRRFVPGLELTVPISGSGRPIRVGLRRAKNFQPTLGDQIVGDIGLNIGSSDCGVKGDIAVQLLETGDVYGTTFQIGSTPGDQGSIGFNEADFVIEPPPGLSSMTLRMNLLIGAAGCSRQFRMSGGAEMFAYEL